MKWWPMTWRRWVAILFGILSLAFVGRPAIASDVRIKNVSKFDYANLQVGEHNFGQLKAGEATEYKTFKVAYDYNYVRLRIDGKEFVIQPEDYVGEKPLGSGCFAYLIDVIDLSKGYYGALSIKAIKEKCPKTVK